MATSTTVHVAAGLFPAATSVKAYKLAEAEWYRRHRKAPEPLSSVSTASVDASGVLTFAGLTAGQQYLAHATVSGAQRWLHVAADPA